MRYSAVFVMGKGRVANEAVKIASEFYKTDVVLLNFKNRCEADEFLSNLNNSLIISANNFYIFKGKAIQNNTIINYHNSILPYHRGVNAHIWAIYDGDDKSGITWHLVDCGIDTGSIIVQRYIDITSQMNSSELLLMQQKEAINSLKECLVRLENSEFMPNPKTDTKPHRKNELPNGAIASFDLSKEQFIRFLRAMHISFFNEIPKAKILVFGKLYEINGYEILDDLINIKLSENLTLTIRG